MVYGIDIAGKTLVVLRDEDSKEPYNHFLQATGIKLNYEEKFPIDIDKITAKYDQIYMFDDLMGPYSFDLALISRMAKKLNKCGSINVIVEDSFDLAKFINEFGLAGFVSFEEGSLQSLKTFKATLPNVAIGSYHFIDAVESEMAFKIGEAIDFDYINPDSLLEEEDVVRPIIKTSCQTEGESVRKACKNCTCGLSEELAKEDMENIKKDFKSSCGNCYLGDAFRCASCPHRGLPPFKPGEKIVFDE